MFATDDVTVLNVKAIFSIYCTSVPNDAKCRKRLPLDRF